MGAERVNSPPHSFFVKLRIEAEYNIHDLLKHAKYFSVIIIK